MTGSEMSGFAHAQGTFILKTLTILSHRLEEYGAGENRLVSPDGTAVRRTSGSS